MSRLTVFSRDRPIPDKGTTLSSSLKLLTAALQLPGEPILAILGSENDNRPAVWICKAPPSGYYGGQTSCWPESGPPPRWPQSGPPPRWPQSGSPGYYYPYSPYCPYSQPPYPAPYGPPPLTGGYPPSEGMPPMYSQPNQLASYPTGPPPLVSSQPKIVRDRVILEYPVERTRCTQTYYNWSQQPPRVTFADDGPFGSDDRLLPSSRKNREVLLSSRKSVSKSKQRRDDDDEIDDHDDASF